MDKSPWKHPHQKLGLMVVVVIGLTTLLFGVISLRKSIFDPFVRRPSAITFKTSDQLEKERIETLKNRDTDGDALTDYEELYIYRTSPFLEDSDSDTIFDGAEVANGTDPNCPKDKVCRQVRTTAGANDGQSTTQPEPSTDQPASDGAAALGADSEGAAIVQLFIDTFGPIEELTPEIIEARMNAMNTTQLKDFFKKLGLPAEAVDKADDATLRQIFLEIIRDLVTQVGSMSTEGGTTGTPPAASQ